VDDLPNIERLLTASGLPTAGVGEILNTRADDFVVAEAMNDAGVRDLVGVDGVEVCCDTALLRSVAVHPAWRKHGVGHELVKRIVCIAAERGLRALYLLTLTAEHYFPRFGFSRIERGEVPAEIAGTLEFKSARPASAIAMAKSLA
jgi:amino-acid N-acetyltransferase